LPVDTREIERLQQTIREDGRRRDVTLVTAVGALGGIVLIATGAGPDWLGYTLLGASVLGLFTLRK
jgi:hypothetical protein